MDPVFYCVFAETRVEFNQREPADPERERRVVWNMKKQSKRIRTLIIGVLSAVLFLTIMPPASAEAADFADSDYRNIATEQEDAVIMLDGDQGILSDTTRGRSGNPVVIERKGIYRITGRSDGVSIQIREPKKSGNIYLILDHVSMTNATASCIDAQAAEKVILYAIGDNSLVSTGEDIATV